MSEEVRDTLIIVAAVASILAVMLLAVIGGMVSGIIEILKRRK